MPSGTAKPCGTGSAVNVASSGKAYLRKVGIRVGLIRQVGRWIAAWCIGQRRVCGR
jgi:hypothetical protein